MLTTRLLTNASAPLCTPSGAPLAGVMVVFELIGASGQLADVWDAITFEHPVGSVAARTDADGVFAVGLWPNTRGHVSTSYRCSISLSGYPSFTGVVEDLLTPLTWVQFMATQLPITPGELTQLGTYLAQIEAAQAAAEAAALAAATAQNALGTVHTEVLTADVLLTSVSSAYQFLDPAGATRAVELPGSGVQEGRGFSVKHTGTAGWLRINLPGGAQLGMLVQPGYAVTCIYTGATWEIL